MKRYSLLLSMVVFIFSCTPRHPNLESDTIVYDDEALAILKYSENGPKIKIAFGETSQKVKEAMVGRDGKIFNRKAVKQALLDSLKAHNILFYNNFLIHALANSGFVHEITISPFGITSIRFKSNKKIRNLRDLKLTCLVFDMARMEKIRNKTLPSKNGQPVYPDMIYSQFKFFDIKHLENIKPEDLTDRLIRR